ncbi:MAG: TRAP transporter small permease subunit [Saprospiraceae bacterium]
MTRWIKNITIWSGLVSSYSTLVLLVLIMIDVFLRTFLSQSYNVLMELQWHFFALIFLLGGSYNILTDKHVRVDFFYEDFSQRNKNLVNFIFHILLLIPWSLVGIYTCYQYASNSFYIREASANPGGLTAIYPIKYIVVLCFVLVLLQGVSEIISLGKNIKNTWNT